MGYVTLCIEALTFHVPGVFETKCEAAPALGEHITLDDPFAEMTAPAEAGNIVKGDEVSPDPTDLQDVFVCTMCKNTPYNIYKYRHIWLYIYIYIYSIYICT